MTDVEKHQSRSNFCTSLMRTLFPNQGALVEHSIEQIDEILSKIGEEVASKETKALELRNNIKQLERTSEKGVVGGVVGKKSTVAHYMRKLKHVLAAIDGLRKAEMFWDKYRIDMEQKRMNNEMGSHLRVMRMQLEQTPQLSVEDLDDDIEAIQEHNDKEMEVQDAVESMSANMWTNKEDELETMLTDFLNDDSGGSDEYDESLTSLPSVPTHTLEQTTSKHTTLSNDKEDVKYSF